MTSLPYELPQHRGAPTTAQVFANRHVTVQSGFLSEARGPALVHLLEETLPRETARPSIQLPGCYRRRMRLCWSQSAHGRYHALRCDTTEYSARQHAAKSPRKANTRRQQRTARVAWG